MSNNDILSKFFNEHFRNKNITNSNWSNSKSKKSNYLKKYNLIYTENNILKFTPINISKPIQNTIREIKPYNLYEKKPFANTQIINYIQKKQSRKNFNKTQNVNYFHKIEEKMLNNYESQNKTSSTCFNSKNLIKRSIKTIPKEKEEEKNILPKKLKDKLKNDNKIEEEIKNIVNHYISTDIFKTKNNIENDNKELDKVEKLKKNIKKKFFMDKKLLKMKNIKHRLMTGDYNNFKSINIQRMTLGKEKNRKSLLKGIEDFYTNRTYRLINDYIIEKKGNNHFLENEKITNEFQFEDNKFKFPLSERIKKRNNLKNRINQNYKDFYTLNKAKSHMNKKGFMNFYEKMDLLKDRVNNTHRHIIKEIAIRQKLKDNINSLFLV